MQKGPCGFGLGFVRVTDPISVRTVLVEIDVKQVENEAEESGAEAVAETANACDDALRHACLNNIT